MAGTLTMGHPFFDAMTFPWHHPDAVPAQRALLAAYPQFDSIDTLYQRCARELRPLSRADGPFELWKSALEALVVAHALSRLCELVLKDTTATVAHKAIRRMVDATEPDSTAERATGTSVERSSISAELRMRVLEVVRAAEFSRDQLVDAYLASAPGIWRPYVRDFQGLDLIGEMLLKLSTALGQHDGSHSILLFVLHLMRLPSAAPVIAQLHDWFKEAASYLEVDPAAQQSMQHQAASAVADARVMHLVVVIRESSSSRNRYSVRAFCVTARANDDRWDERDIRPLDTDPDLTYAVNHLQNVLNELFDQVIEELHRCNNNVTVELMVPLGLLGCDADRWALQRGLGESVPLGVDYHVILRSWERSYDPSCRRIAPVWEAKWRTAQVPNTQAWVCTQADAGRINTTLHGDGPTSIFVGFAPELDAVLRPIVAAGVPVAVWPREVQTPCQLDKCIADFATRPMSWPTLVQDYRRQAHSGDDPRHLGHHLSVLWDDPNKRLPDARPSARLVSPSRNKKSGL